MPNGTVASITSSSNPDLFYGLRVSIFNDMQIVSISCLMIFVQGGFNNFVRDDVASQMPVHVLIYAGNRYHSDYEDVRPVSSLGMHSYLCIGAILMVTHYRVGVSRTRRLNGMRSIRL